WYFSNPEHEPCKWAAGRLYTYGDGTGRPDHPNWHRSLFTPRYLKQLCEQAGLMEVRQMTRSEVRGADHGWINLGFRGIKAATEACHPSPRPSPREGRGRFGLATMAIRLTSPLKGEGEGASGERV